MTRRLHEGKYELDSLAAVLKHFNNYYEYTGDSACFRPDWIDAMVLILDTITDQQISTRTRSALTPASDLAYPARNVTLTLHRQRG